MNILDWYGFFMIVRTLIFEGAQNRHFLSDVNQPENI